MVSESGEMCAMKEVTLFSDDAKSKESAKQLMQASPSALWQKFNQPLACLFISFMCLYANLSRSVLEHFFLQEISLLSRLQHPNIVQYYGSDTVYLLYYCSFIYHDLSVVVHIFGYKQVINAVSVTILLS